VALPWLVNAVYSALSLINGAAYFIDPANIYHRGPGFWLMPAACYSYIAIYLVHALRNRKALPKQSFTTLLIVALPPIIAGILQVLFFGISVLWLALSFSLLITYLNLQSTYANMDYLTGLANRRQFDIVFRAYSRKKRIVGGIMMDIDDFKHINDVYGHLMGDMVLEKTGMLLKGSLRKGDFVARLGGDEFIVLLDIGDLAQLENAVQRIRDNIRCFNAGSGFPFHLRLSMGYDLWDIAGGQTPEAFYNRIDKKMYSAKNKGEGPDPQPAAVLS
jgi:diguanylate cyclase (GGDEF)-like protein